MSTSSPGQARSAWSASLPPNELPIELFFRSGVSTIPVALVPTNGGSIRITNPQAVQKALKATSNHFQTITDVRAFGRGGIVCRSPEQTCVEDLLKCTSFASTPSSSGLPAEELDRAEEVLRRLGAEVALTLAYLKVELVATCPYRSVRVMEADTT
ncbi:uncharacterized protein [Dermacentor albipictus]|uniref:uncharacterized protein isoform X2 n=1 Tax=Dermacentor albipictus TaxID=60249 RepID=UPI0038FC70B4